MNELLQLQKWYSRQCNKEWEHHFGVTIASCDNPGWWVKIDLTGTALESKPFTCVARNIDPKKIERISMGLEPDMCDRGPDWMLCQVKEQVFDGSGDETKLQIILRTFLEWAAEESTSEQVADGNPY